MNQTEKIEIKEDLICYHCGDKCSDNSINIEDKLFCCNGCKTVYEILSQNDLCDYYNLNSAPGLNPNKNLFKHKFEFLDDETVKQKIINFTDGKITTVTFFVRQMHCSSCIWLLENLYKFDPAVFYSKVNFLKKEISIKFYEEKISLREVVEILASLGYEPELNLDQLEKEKNKNQNKSLYYKIGIAGFAFGNIMLLSFPEYLSIVDNVDNDVRFFLGLLSLLLSLPVFFYCSSDYFKSAYNSLKKKIINIDFPISLGILVLFFRSAYEIISQTGPGFLDSLAGLLFFLLLGKLFQSKTYDSINFDRNYRSYFPLAVIQKKDEKEISVPVSNLKKNDIIVVRNNELIPADSILIKGKANIDYSFVTGEHEPVEKNIGNTIYAGGKQIGSAIELSIQKEVSQSYFTQLWNDNSFSENKEDAYYKFTQTISKYFSIIVLLIAFGAGFYWLQFEVEKAVNVFTAVLIIACPCALAISLPFTLGNTLRIFGRNKFYLKNDIVVENIAEIDTIVFDKTGTITKSNSAGIQFSGDEINQEEKSKIRTLVRNSSHPLSKKIYELFNDSKILEVQDFSEITGEGIEGKVNESLIKIGSRKFVNQNQSELQQSKFDTTVYVSIDEIQKGFFKINNIYREGLKELIDSLKNFKIKLLSGDNEGEKENLKKIFAEDAELLFNQTPKDKLNFISKLQSEGKKVLMLGDGLNDAGALKKSNVGISISEDINNFSPACDAILDAEKFNKIPDFIKFSHSSMKVVKINLIISLLYNVIGISFAVKGILSPLIAAILMPLSSITVVLIATLFTNLIAKKRGLI